MRCFLDYPRRCIGIMTGEATDRIVQLKALTQPLRDGGEHLGMPGFGAYVDCIVLDWDS